MELKLQPNEKRCNRTLQSHVLTIPPCCPISGNPKAGSTITIKYVPEKSHLEVDALQKFIASYAGGKGDVRSMEGMIQDICKEVSDNLGTTAHVDARLVLNPGDQIMELQCSHFKA